MTAFKTGPALLLIALLGACGGEQAPDTASDVANPAGAAPAADQLTQKELDQGIGPIHDLELAPLDAALLAEGETAYTLKCSACHKLEERYIGPELGTILSRRQPEFVMNMMLNAGEMVLRHPVVKELLAEYFTPMPVQVTEEAEARAILEYIRSNQIDTP